MFLCTSMRVGRGAWRVGVVVVLLVVTVPAIGQDEPPSEEQYGPADGFAPVDPPVDPPVNPAEQAGQAAPAAPFDPTASPIPVASPLPADQAVEPVPPALPLPVDQAVGPAPVEMPQAQPVPVDVPAALTKKQRRQLRRQQQLAAGVITPAGPSMKDVFAGTLAAVLQTSGSAMLTSVAQVVTGRLVDWFSRKLAPQPTPAWTPPDAYVPVPAPEAQAAAWPPEPGLAEQPAVLYEAPAGLPQVTALAPPGGIAAGLAFEVHRLEAGGATVLVDPEVHDFRTGERFVVFFRPSLPGRIDIYNINPAGLEALIDTQELAAGQLTRLGPYEFTAATGDEQLRLVLQPCSSPALVSATRDIVRVPDAMPAGDGLGLPGCATSVTRSARTVTTRDIRRVTVEDGTSFALDRVSGDELASGQVAPREVTIRFRHR